MTDEDEGRLAKITKSVLAMPHKNREESKLAKPPPKSRKSAKKKQKSADKR